MTEIIGIEPADHSQAVIDRVSSLLANKGILYDNFISGFDDGEGGVGHAWRGMANGRVGRYILEPQHISEEEIEPRSISIANEVEAAIRQARDPETDK